MLQKDGYMLGYQAFESIYVSYGTSEKARTWHPHTDGRNTHESHDELQQYPMQRMTMKTRANSTPIVGRATETSNIVCASTMVFLDTTQA
jgi:hypothetical protein